MEDLLVQYGVITTRCYRTFVHKYDFLDADCLKMLLSKMLGYGVIAGSVGVKVPQILSILQARSAAGISMMMFLLELVGLTISLGYNVMLGNPFSTWGENLFLLAQTVVLLLLMLHFSGGIGLKSMAAGGLWVAFLTAILQGLIPASQMAMLQTASIGLFVMSKVPQVLTNFKTRSTGKLAFLTFFLNTAGAGARIFTTIQEVPDTLILISASLSFTLNLIITIQILVFGDKSSQKPPMPPHKSEPSIATHRQQAPSTLANQQQKQSLPNVIADMRPQSPSRRPMTPLPENIIPASSASTASGNSAPLANDVSPASPLMSAPRSPRQVDTSTDDDSNDPSSSYEHKSDGDEAVTDETTSMPTSSPRLQGYSSSDDASSSTASTHSRSKVTKLLGEDPVASSSDDSAAPSKKDKKEKDKKDKKADKERRDAEKKAEKERKKAEKSEEKKLKKKKD